MPPIVSGSTVIGRFPFWCSITIISLLESQGFHLFPFRIRRGGLSLAVPMILGGLNTRESRACPEPVERVVARGFLKISRFALQTGFFVVFMRHVTLARFKNCRSRFILVSKICVEIC